VHELVLRGMELVERVVEDHARTRRYDHVDRCPIDEPVEQHGLATETYWVDGAASPRRTTVIFAAARRS